MLLAGWLIYFVTLICVWFYLYDEYGEPITMRAHVSLFLLACAWPAMLAARGFRWRRG